MEWSGKKSETGVRRLSKVGSSKIRTWPHGDLFLTRLDRSLLPLPEKITNRDKLMARNKLQPHSRFFTHHPSLPLNYKWVVGRTRSAKSGSSRVVDPTLVCSSLL
jgi:hypothetical protein